MDGKINIEFEERAVAFVDVLGFTQLVLKAESSEDDRKELGDLVNNLKNAVEELDKHVSQKIPPHLLPKHLYISDCIILSAPIKDPNEPWYNGFEIVVMRCIQLAHLFLNKGFLLNGGVAIGNVWHETNNIIGSGYQEAYKLTCRKDIGPRIILSKKASKIWEEEHQGNFMCIDDEGAMIVNGLHDYYIPEKEKHGGIKVAFGRYRKIIESKIDELKKEIEQANNKKDREKKERALANWNKMNSLLEKQLKLRAGYIAAEQQQANR